MRQSLVVTVALVAGFAGGMVGSRASLVLRQTHPEEVVRAQSFELIDRTGRVTSRWGIDGEKNVVLAFGRGQGVASGVNNGTGFGDPDRQKVTIGLMADDSGFLTLRGNDGKSRVRLYLSEYDKPYLLLEDETGVRVSLGHQQSDTPSPEDNDWALNFHPERASIGMYTRRQGTQTFLQGFVSVHQDKVRFP